MSTATPFPRPELSEAEGGVATFRAIFEHAPIAVARCNPQGIIVEMNPAFEQALDRSVASRRSLRLGELVSPQDRGSTELLLSELLARRRDTISVNARGAGFGQAIAKWTAWRQPGPPGEPDHALFIAEPGSDSDHAEESLIQAQRWEAVGRLTGGVVHDFNNLLTGVMLCCDLLLSSLDSRDRRRRYADEIRSAIVQAGSLVQQLLVFARPQATAAQALCLNDVVVAMQDLLARLIGENIVLDLHLDPALGAVKIDQAQAQQILLNLVLNARDALPDGGRITVETSNCRFQPTAGSVAQNAPPAFPCVLLVVADNGHGMTNETRQRLFEPFFTTKAAGKGTGLGLTTVRSIVTTNRGLLHFETEPGHGTRVMILLPRAPQPSDSDHSIASQSDSGTSPAPPFQEIEKESLL